jgi:hypothetical protein
MKQTKLIQYVEWLCMLRKTLYLYPFGSKILNRIRMNMKKYRVGLLKP